MERLYKRELITNEDLIVVDIDDVLNYLGEKLYQVMDDALGVKGNPHEYDFGIRYPNHSVNTLWFEVLPKRFWVEVQNFLPNTLDQLNKLVAMYPAQTKILVCTARGKLSTEEGIDRLILDFIEAGCGEITLAVCNYYESKIDSIKKEFPNNEIITIVEDSPTTLAYAVKLNIPNVIRSPRPYNKHIETGLEWCQTNGIQFSDERKKDLTNWYS